MPPNSPQNSNDLFLNKIDTIITDTFMRLTGYMFDYDENGINEDLFTKFLKIDPSRLSNIDLFVSQANVKLDSKKIEFEHLKIELQNKGKNILGNKYEYLVENFKKIEVFYKLLELYIPIEAEKIEIFISQGDEYFGSQGNKIKHIRKIESLEEEIFGKKISDVLKHTKVALNNIRELYQENSLLDVRDKNKLTSKENLFLQECLVKIEGKTGVSTILNQYPKNTTGKLRLEDPLLSVEGFDDSILQTKIPREKYVKVLKLAIKILGLTNFEVIQDAKFVNMSIDAHSINIPLNEDYETLTIKRILELITHELEKHAIGNSNNGKIIGNLKSLTYLGQDEGAAHVFEKLGQGNDLDHIPLNRYLSRMLGGEILSGYEFKKFLKIMNRLDGEKINVETFFRRFKRGKDFQLPGVNPKEKMYGIGAIEIIQRLRKGENPLGFFLAKNGGGEQEQVNEMVIGNNKLTPKNLDKVNIILPLLLGELLRYKLLKSDEDNKGMLGGFLKHFKDRYGGLFNALGISTQDFITNTISQNKNETRNNVAKILEIFHSEI